MEKKITKVERFNQLKAIPEVAENADLVAFIDHEIELLQKKSGSKKPTATQVANEGLKDTIVSILEAGEMTASEVLNATDEFKGLSNQKISALLKQLVDEGRVAKSTDGKKSLFSVVA